MNRTYDHFEQEPFGQKIKEQNKNQSHTYKNKNRSRTHEHQRVTAAVTVATTQRAKSKQAKVAKRITEFTLKIETVPLDDKGTRQKDIHCIDLESRSLSLNLDYYEYLNLYFSLQ